MLHSSRTVFKRQKMTEINFCEQNDKNPQEGPGRRAAFGHITGQNGDGERLSELPVNGR
jgi:hypothetical protein